MTTRALFLSAGLLAPIGCTPAAPSTPAANAPPVEREAPPESPGAPMAAPAPDGAPPETPPAIAKPEPAPGATEEPVGSSAPPADGDRCAALPRTRCMASPDCTLDQPSAIRPSPYRCRRATAPCELGMVQDRISDPTSASHRACMAKPGCAVDPGDCYCPCRGVGKAAVPDGDEAPLCSCECGNGPPPTCAAKP